MAALRQAFQRPACAGENRDQGGVEEVEGCRRAGEDGGRGGCCRREVLVACRAQEEGRGGEGRGEKAWLSARGEGAKEGKEGRGGGGGNEGRLLRGKG